MFFLDRVYDLRAKQDAARNNALQQQAMQYQNQYMPDYLQSRNSLEKSNAGLAGVKLQYAPQMEQADLTGKQLVNQYYGADKMADIGMKRAQTGLIGQQTKYYGPETTSKMNYQDAMTARMNGLTGMGALPGGGVSISYDDQGRPIVQTGGFIKDPRMGSNRAGEGGTYIDPQTGKATSTDTSSMTTTDQTAIAGAQRVTPLIKNIVKNLPQFQTAGNRLEEKAEGFANEYFGGNYDKPSQLAQAKADLDVSAEGLIKAYGLRVTDKALDMMKGAIQPMKGESPQGYENRLLSTLNTISDFDGQSKSRLLNGTDITPPNAGAAGAPQNIDKLSLDQLQVIANGGK